MSFANSNILEKLGRRLIGLEFPITYCVSLFLNYWFNNCWFHLCWENTIFQWVVNYVRQNISLFHFIAFKVCFIITAGISSLPLLYLFFTLVPQYLMAEQLKIDLVLYWLKNYYSKLCFVEPLINNLLLFAFAFISLHILHKALVLWSDVLISVS